LKACIVFAHPGEQSFNHEILHRVVSACERAGVSPVVRDLYHMNFKPVFSAHDMAQVEQGRVSSDIEQEQELLTDADLLVMIYPVWWWSQPAILKGWIDRVFTLGYAFRYGEDGPVGLLTGKRAAVFTTSRESAQEMARADLDDVVRKQIVDGTLELVGFDQVVHKHFAAVPYVSDQERTAMLEEVERTINSLFKPVTV